MKLRRATLIWPLAGLVVAGAAWLDHGAEERSMRALVSAAPGARRVFPELGDREAADATIEFQAPDAALVRLVPNPEGGHTVMAGEELLGPADAEAVEGIWASLRLATTLRAAPAGLDVGSGHRGVIRLAFSDHTMTLELGAETPDGSGLYGVLAGEDGAAWVVEDELAWLVDQAPEAWLSVRLSALEPARVAGLEWDGGRRVQRADDGRFRASPGTRALLSTEAVESRAGRLLAARLDPLLGREVVDSEQWRPWLQVTTDAGETIAFQRGEACPGDDNRVVVDRGPGRVGCIDGDLVSPWELEGNGLETMLESRLVPHAYGRILAIEDDSSAVLRRRPGGWRLEDEAGALDVADDEVYRYFDQLSRTDVELAPALPETERAAGVTFDMDSGQKLHLRCVDDASNVVCRRDEGPALSVVGGLDLASLAVSRKTFAPRQLADFSVDDVRAIEIEDADGTRQSLHYDLGVWSLDAPEHPDGSDAIDDIRLEGLLSALANLRAKTWVDAPDGTAMRTLAVDLTPAGDRPNRLEFRLWADCAVVVGQGRAASLSTASCETLAGDVFYDDPLRFWLQSARSVDVEGIEDGAQKRRFERQGSGWRRAGGEALDAADSSLLESLTNWRAQGVASYSDEHVAESRLTIRRTSGSDVHVELGSDFMRVRGARWVYRAANGVRSD